MGVGEVEVVLGQFRLPVEDEVAKFAAARPTIAATLRTASSGTFLTSML
jgi:hypothetical protein